MKIIEKNIEFLERRIPYVSNDLQEREDIQDIKVNINASLNAKYFIKNNNSIFLHSIYDVQNEMNKMFSKLDKQVESLVIFGCGEGHFIEEIKTRYPKLKNLMLIEPSKKLFINFINISDLSKLNITSNLTIVINRTIEETYNMALDFIKTNIKTNIGFVYHMYIISAFEDYYTVVMKKLHDYIKNLRINLNTVRSTARINLINELMNIRFSSEHCSENFSKFLNSKVVTIVSAGPSLGREIDKIEELKKKSIVIAVGTAIKILEENGVKPHFRFFMDPFDENMEIFKDVYNDDVPLIFMNSMYYEILNYYKGPIIRIAIDSEYLVKYFYNTIGKEIEYYKSNYSIASVTHDFIIKSGASKIVLLGQDLSFSGKKRYAKGSWNDDEKIDFNLKDYIEITNNLGEKSYTDLAYWGMKDQFELMISETNIPHYNVSLGGASIKGTTLLPLSDLLLDLNYIDEYSIKNELSKDIKDGYSYENQKLLFKHIWDDSLFIKKSIETKFILIKQLEESDGYSKIEKLKEVFGKLIYIDSELAKNPFYSSVVEAHLKLLFQAYDISFNIENVDEIEKYKNEIQKHITKNAEIHDYIEIVFFVLNELKKIYKKEE
ncbi:motility associated factor glycosyltransferase family protein [Helicovermis profundi]|uniref:DUF115 domain-containing protein n=1 Tax=Helicovermis profundi TaxID=3065157 RepID=A0AAU9E6T6_9FIRM|nr:DUF115 domain-containing protein [Clostridia bacterium S502]